MTVGRNYVIFLDKMIGVNTILSLIFFLRFYNTLSSLTCSFTYEHCFLSNTCYDS